MNKLKSPDIPVLPNNSTQKEVKLAFSLLQDWAKKITDTVNSTVITTTSAIGSALSLSYVLNSVQNYQALVYDAASGFWKNKTYDHTWLTSAGSNSHASIDTHLGYINSNPHGTDHTMLDGILGNGEYHLSEDESLEVTALDELIAGIVAKTADATYEARTITGTTGKITVADGDGVSGNPTISLPDVITTPLKFGDSTNNTEIEADGTVKFNGSATVWDDIATTLSAEKVTGTTRAVMSNGFALYRMGINDAAEYDPQEVSHAYKQGSEIEFHLHWIVDDTTPDVGDSWVRWRIEFAYIAKSSVSPPFPVYSALQTIEGQTMIPANTPAMSELTTSIGTLLDTDMKMASRIMVRVKRIAATGSGTTTAPSVNPYLCQTGIHIERDTNGSREIGSK